MPYRPTTPRGFAIYGEVADTHGNLVRVQESSLADDHCAWIFAEHGEQGRVSRDRFLARFGNRFDGIDLDELGAFLEPAPHLTVEQAKQVRDALNEFISEHETRED